MMSPSAMSGKKVGILGLGASGMAAARSLDAAGASTWLHDDRMTPSDLPASATSCDWQNWPWDQLDSMVISPGIPHLHPRPHPAAAKARDAGIEIISEVEVALRATPSARLVAITGTNGKSTTTALIGHCLQSAGVPNAVGGNIGDAACNLSDPGTDGIIVLELSSYQLETTPSLAADVAIILNITPDHLDRHGGMDGYVAAKAQVLAALDRQQPQGGLAILGDGDDHVRHLASLCRDKGRIDSSKLVIAHGANAPQAVQDNPALAGSHNAENAAAAAACLRYLGLSEAAIEAGMAGFAGLAHRMQPVAHLDAHGGRITFVNDSKATNGVAAARALGAFDNIYWIAGGEAKEDGLGEAADALAAVKKAYLIGSAAAEFAVALDGRCASHHAGTIDIATETAFEDATSAVNAGAGDATILLSPAAASFDQFASFMARGEAFTAIARQLTAGMPTSTSTNNGGAHA